MSETTISQTMPCDDCDVRTATRSSWCGVLFGYVLCFVCMLFVSGASEPTACVEHRRSWTLLAIHSVLWVRSILLRFVSVSRACFFTRHCLSPERTIYLGSARTWNTNVQALCLVACERPVVPPCGSKFVFQRVTAQFCCSSSLRWNVPAFAVSVRFRHFFFEGACCVRFLQYCDISVFASLLGVYRSRYQTLECNGTVFCVHMQVAFISRLLASWAFVWFFSNIVVAFRVFREFDSGLYGCHGTI